MKLFLFTYENRFGIMRITMQIERRLGLCKTCGTFYKCQASKFSKTKYCSRKCQLKGYEAREKREALIGKVFGRLTVYDFYGKDNKGNYLWRCKCLCGNDTIANTVSLKRRSTKSCGCLRGCRVK